MGSPPGGRSARKPRLLPSFIRTFTGSAATGVAASRATASRPAAHPRLIGRAGSVLLVLVAARARRLATRLQLLLAPGELLAERLELVLVHELARARKHLLLLFARVVLDEVLQDLRLRRELGRANLVLVDLGQDHVDDVVLFHGFVVELGVVLPARRLAEGRVEDLLLDGRVYLQLGLDRLEEGLDLAAVIH